MLQRYELFPKLANLSIIIYANRPRLRARGGMI